MNAIQRLRDSGLIVGPSNSYSSMDHAPLSEITSFSVYKNEPAPDVGIHLYLRNQRWTLEQIQYIPYPGPTDFSCTFDSLDEVVDAAITFYTGKPTIINNWIIPLHQHPELQVEGIAPALHQAIYMSADDYAEIKENYWQEFAEMMETYRNDNSRTYEDMWDDVWHAVYNHQFLKIFHVQDTTKVLYLRRDLKKAYIVEKE